MKKEPLRAYVNSIHEKINCRSWFSGRIMNSERLVRVVEGCEYWTPNRLRVHIPYMPFMKIVSSEMREKPKPQNVFIQPINFYI